MPPLSQAVGYVVVVGIGLAIALGMIFVTRLLKKTVGEDNKKTEMFMAANRNVRTGLATSAVISSWLWSTAMLGSSLVGYTYGVAGPFWFAAGCSPMIVFFALLRISYKRKIPKAHNLLEIIRIRYSTAAHFVWMFLCLVNNIIACGNMLLGASAAIAALTGMQIIAVTFLLPLRVALCTFMGGIKATFLTDYVWTLPEVGSVGNLYELVKTATDRHPIAGNHDGTYMTMASKGGIYFESSIYLPTSALSLWKHPSSSKHSPQRQGQTLPCVYGMTASAFSPSMYSFLLSFYKPQNYDWGDFQKEKLAFDVVTTSSDGRSVSIVTAEQIEAEVHSVPTAKGTQAMGPHRYVLVTDYIPRTLGSVAVANIFDRPQEQSGF
ncbi:urea active transporter [Curvularia clavata]|uniref:Urea active transporter n=1 Tax=Curvularia clavata TaxID=95742 RepID=A0A9Q9DVI1_CURCL|nr:urea active transporter [Curvularia clavata]